MLCEAHRSDAVDGDSQNGDEQMNKCDPVGKERPVEKSRIISGSICWETDKNYIYIQSSSKENRISCLTCGHPCPQSAS